MPTVLRVAATTLLLLALIAILFPIPARLWPSIALVFGAVLFLGLGSLLERIGGGR